jgi:hypothetical protein
MEDSTKTGHGGSTPDSPLRSTLEELWRDGVLQRAGARFQTTRRWRAARHRASSAPEGASERVDLRNPIVLALMAFYGGRRALAALSPYVEVLLAIEVAERAPHSVDNR